MVCNGATAASVLSRMGIGNTAVRVGGRMFPVTVISLMSSSLTESVSNDCAKISSGVVSKRIDIEQERTPIVTCLCRLAKMPVFLRLHLLHRLHGEGSFAKCFFILFLFGE